MQANMHVAPSSKRPHHLQTIWICLNVADNKIFIVIQPAFVSGFIESFLCQFGNENAKKRQQSQNNQQYVSNDSMIH